jgi:hypothetical protein
MTNEEKRAEIIRQLKAKQHSLEPLMRCHEYRDLVHADEIAAKHLMKCRDQKVIDDITELYRDVMDVSRHAFVVDNNPDWPHIVTTASLIPLRAFCLLPLSIPEQIKHGTMYELWNMTTCLGTLEFTQDMNGQMEHVLGNEWRITFGSEVQFFDRKKTKRVNYTITVPSR